MITALFCHRDLSWVKIYNVDQRYEANRIKGNCYGCAMFSCLHLLEILLAFDFIGARTCYHVLHSVHSSLLQYMYMYACSHRYYSTRTCMRAHIATTVHVHVCMHTSLLQYMYMYACTHCHLMAPYLRPPASTSCVLHHEHPHPAEVYIPL